MNDDRYYEEIEVGESGTTDARTVTETDVSLYAGIVGDYDPRHNAKTGDGRTVQPFLVVALAVPLHMGINEHAYGYGFDDVTFHEPVSIGDTIHVEWKYTDKEERTEKGGLVTTHAKVRSQREETAIEYRFVRLVDKASYFAPGEA